jgi:hypothetical protein
MPSARCGPDVLAEFLRRNDHADARPAASTLDEFRDWLAARIAEHQRNPVFVQQCRVRDLIRSHRLALRRHEDAVRRARTAYDASPHRQRLEQLAARLDGLERAVAGLTEAVEAQRADPRKLAAFRIERNQVQAEHQALAESMPEKIRLDQAEASLIRLRDAIGLSAAESQLNELRRQRGGRLVKSGRRFESVAERAVWDLLVPIVPPAAGPLLYLTGVTLGSARMELDGVLATLPADDGDDPDRVVDVLALVEAKRNPNDVAKGFRIRQDNLAWLTGERGRYDADSYRTRTFKQGHFDRPAAHTQGGRTYRFDVTSFHRFERDPQSGCFLRGLCFVVADRPLVGVGTAQLGRVMHRLAGDPKFDLSRDSVVHRYHAWVRAMTDPMPTRDVLELYAAKDALARQIVFVTQP